MIVTDLQHIDQQIAMEHSMQQAIDFLHRMNLLDLPDGNVPIEGKRVFAFSSGIGPPTSTRRSSNTIRLVQLVLPSTSRTCLA
jgi:beta-galactosidase beta subunit